MTKYSDNNKSGAALSEVPALRSFEFDKTAIGNIKSSVNKFRGSVSLPLDFLTIPGLEGLDVKLSALYSSSIKNTLNTWNIDSPTGILGMGWQMPIEMIVVDKAGSASASSDTFYLISGGASNPMVKTGETADGQWIFQLRNYQFWSVQYNPSNKTWAIIKENGFIYTYGEGNSETSNATQWGISWGNWIGSSCVGASQVKFPIAWNLASIQTPMGNTIQYEYLNINQKLKDSGLAYTQASYLQKVIDSYGRIITFNYGNKFGVLNPDSDGGRVPIVEYQPQHTQIAPPNPNAYQDRYETLFLDDVQVKDPQGKLLSGLKFTYTFINNAPTSDPNYSLLYKRSLHTVFQYADNGQTLPAMQFEYFPTTNTSINPGALKSVIYPEGGTAFFNYKTQVISSTNSSKKVQLVNPIPGSTPRVWFGQDFVVVTYTSQSKLQLVIQSWNGQWTSQNLNFNISADKNSMSVLTGNNFFALSFRNTATGNDELYLFRNDDKGQELQFGKWKLYNNQPFILSLKAGSSTNSVFVAGNDFVMAYNKDYTAARVQGFSYSWQDGRWNGSVPPPVPPTSDCEFASISAFQNYYIVSCYIKSSRQLKNYIFYRQAEGNWSAGNAGNPWTLNNIDVFIDSQTGLMYLTITPLPTSLIFTFATSVSSSAINYGLRLYNWNENFFIINASIPASVDLIAPIVNGEAIYQVFQTLVAGSTVNNNLALLRNAGGDQSSGSVWNQRSYSTPGASIPVKTAVGVDVSILTPTSGSTVNQLATFNPNNGSWLINNGMSGTFPTISDNYMTVGNSIYFRNTDGNWRSLASQLYNFNYPQSLQNKGPRFLAYQDTGDSTASTYLVPLKNGTALQAQKLGSVKMYVQDSASQLVSGRFMVTYPSTATSFDASPSMDLWNLDEVNFDDYIKDTPVANIKIENKYDEAQNFTQSYYYANSPESQIVYNSAMAVAQYPLVTVVPGVENLSSEPNEMPQGMSQFFYSNGLANQTSLYPAGGIQNYQNILNGIQLAQKDFNSAGDLVSSKLDYWTVFTKDLSGKYYYGGYARCEKSQTTNDGILQWTNAGYDKNTGMLIWQEKSYYDSAGILKYIKQETIYANQIPMYADDFNRQHIFSAIAMTIQSVSPSDGSYTTYTKSEATTYRNWANTNQVTTACLTTEPCRLAAYETYVWTTPGSKIPQFPDLDLSDWQLKTRIKSRTDATYLIQEQEEGTGLVSSFVYDTHQQFLIAKFPNGSITENEVSYYGFESYENNQGWQLGTGASIIPNSQFPTIDAHTGTNSLMIAPLSSGDKGIQKTFLPTKQDKSFVFSAWVKKPSTFDNNGGNAIWKITVSGGSTYNLEFPDTKGEWVYIFQLIEMPIPDGNSQILIQCDNSNTNSHVLIDNLRFTPLSCLYEAYSYDKLLQQPAVILGCNGETTRKIYDDFQQLILSTNPADRTGTIQNNYFSRKGNQGTFSITDPNHSLNITASNGGQLTEFTHGDQWQEVWQPTDNVWIVDQAKLTQQANNLSGSLSYIDHNLTSEYALGIAFNTKESVTSPLGIQLGANIRIQWDPTQTNWQMIDNSGSEILPSVDVKSFIIAKDPYSAQLDAGIISAALVGTFENAGYLLPEGTTISTGAYGAKGWTLTSPDNAYRYALKTDGNQIDVYAMNTQWTLLVGKSTIVFWADGKLIFSYDTINPISAIPQLFFGNRVAISQISTALNPMASLSFDDSRGLNIQNQQYAETQMIINQGITDQLGRVAVRSKPAFISAAQNPMFMYCNGFAMMDWANGTMSGLVSTAYPSDNGYPFARQTFELSPSGRVTQESIPGEQFKVDGGHCTKFAYGAVIGGVSNENIFSKKTITNPNGDVFEEISTLLEQVIQNSSIAPNGIKNETDFDDFGNAITVRTPNYFAPPANSQQSDWLTTQTFDFMGRLTTLKQGTKIVSNYIYDIAGNVRFSLTPQGAADGFITYTKYDILSRPLETGYFAGTWDEALLQNYAVNDAAYPVNCPTWREKNVYDANSDAKNLIGRISKMEANNGQNGNADVHETLFYDIFGNTISDGIIVDGFDSEERIVEYSYNDMGTILNINYPSQVDNYTIFYEINALNQISKISDQVGIPSTETITTNTIGTFTYDASGNPLQNELMIENNGVVKQSFGFNSPNWLNQIRTQVEGGANLFIEALTYTEGGYGGDGYFDGSIASSSIQVASEAANQFKYAYDEIGQIKNAQNQTDASLSLGINPNLGYDANGNIENIALGNKPFTYQYNQGTQEVNNIIEAGTSSQVATFVYDLNGNVTGLDMTASAISNEHLLTMQYDAASLLPTQVTDSKPSGVQLGLIYGCRNERVVKTVAQGDPSRQGKKLYIRGTNALPIQEIFLSNNGNTETIVNYVYGPSGLIAMRRVSGPNLGMYHVLKDHLGSVTAVIDLQGIVVASYQYQTYGMLSAINEPFDGFMPYLYTGQEYDAEISLYNYRARFYCAGIGRFIAIDPGRQYFSPYLYASNNPVLFIDPTGMFSIGSFFSAIAGVFIGAVEILIGVVIDAVAGVLEVVTGGLGTPAAIGLAALSGVFYGAGISAITYSVFHYDDFSWKDYGIQMGIGALTGALSGGLGAAAGIFVTPAVNAAAKSAQVALTEFGENATWLAGVASRVGSSGISTASRAAAWVGTQGARGAEAIAGLTATAPVASGWTALAKGIGTGIIKSEVIGVSINTGKNLAMGNDWDTGLAQTIFSSALSGSIGGLQVKPRATQFANKISFLPV